MNENTKMLRENRNRKYRTFDLVILLIGAFMDIK